MPSPNGRKPPAPPPHSSSGKGPCDATIVANMVYLAVFLMNMFDRKKAK